MTPTTELGVHTGQINYMRREHFRRFSVWTTETQGEGSSREETLDRAIPTYILAALVCKQMKDGKRVKLVVTLLQAQKTQSESLGFYQ
jgi:hypothetical protein